MAGELNAALARADARTRIPGISLTNGIQQGRLLAGQGQQFALQAKAGAVNERFGINDILRKDNLDRMAKQKQQALLKSNEQRDAINLENQGFKREDRQKQNDLRVAYNQFNGIESESSFGQIGTDDLSVHLGDGLKPYAGDFIEAGEKYGLDPRFLASISKLETANGTSSAFRNKNNAMGISNSSGPIALNSVRDSIFKQAESLSREGGYYDGANTISEIGSIYAPPGAGNDPRGTNGYWPSGVGKFFTEMGGDPNASIRGGFSVPATSVDAPDNTLFPGGGNEPESQLEGVRLSANSDPATQQPQSPTASPQPEVVTVDSLFEQKTELENRLRTNQSFISAGVEDTAGIIPKLESEIAEIETKIQNEPLITPDIVNSYAAAKTAAERTNIRIKVSNQAARRGWEASRTTRALSALEEAVEEVKEEKKGLTVAERKSLIESYQDGDSDLQAALIKEFPEIRFIEPPFRGPTTSSVILPDGSSTPILGSSNLNIPSPSDDAGVTVDGDANSEAARLMQ